MMNHRIISVINIFNTSLKNTSLSNILNVISKTAFFKLGGADYSWGKREC